MGRPSTKAGAPKKTGQPKSTVKQKVKKNKKPEPPAPPVKVQPKKKDEVTYDSSDATKPFPNGLNLFCNKNGVYRRCTVLEKRRLSSEDRKDQSHTYEYYVHYKEWDRRMDEWVARDQLKPEDQMTAEDMKAGDDESKKAHAKAKQKSGKGKKGKGSNGKGGKQPKSKQSDKDDHKTADVDRPTKRQKTTGAAGERKDTVTDSDAGLLFEGDGENGSENGSESGSGVGPIGDLGVSTSASSAMLDEDDDDDDGEAHHGEGEGEDDATAAHGGNHHGFTEDELKAHEEATKVKNVTSISLGRYEMDTWYYSPFPREYSQFSKLYFCSFCLNFFGYELEWERHARRCTLRHPPGNEIYRSEEENITVAVFEVDGLKETIYCQNLCYIAKLFLDHKTLEYDCSPFLFYILCEVDSRGCHLVGYFSKEKKSEMGYNLACILTLPCHQQKGFGKFLISLSYELSKIEHKAGSPEKPISDLGKVSYLSYWSKELVKVLKDMKEGDQISIKDLSRITCITPDDIEETLKEYDLLTHWKGKWVISTTKIEVLGVSLAAEEKKAAAHSGASAASAAQSNANQAGQAGKLRIFVRPCDPTKLHWTPFVVRDSKERQKGKASKT